MNIEKKKRIHSFTFRGELICSICTLFVFFVFGLLSIFYFSYSNSVQNTYIEQVVSTSEQALNNYSNYIDNVVNVSDGIQKKLDQINLNTNKSEAVSFFDNSMIISNEINFICVYDLDGNLLVHNTFYTEKSTAEQIKAADWFIQAQNSPLVNVFSRVDSASSFMLSKLMTYATGEYSAILRIQYDFTSIASMIDEARLGNKGHVYIFDSFYNTVYSKNSISLSEKEKIKELVLGTGYYSDENGNFFLYISTIPSTRWRVAIVSNIEGIQEARSKLILNSLIYFFISIVAFIFIISIISNQLTKPLVRLQKEMEAVENLNYKIQASNKTYGTREIVALNKTFISMMHRIQDLTLEVVNEQKEQNKAELKALQNQINPHFLYNTLDSIIYLIDNNENDKAQEMIVALSRFFRISISKGKNIIPVKSEIEHVRNYLKIQKMRFGDTFNYKFEIDENVNDYYVIKLILQPLVENAIVHGLGETPQKDSDILIKSYLKDSYLCFEIIDNGYGILPEKIDEIYEAFRDKNLHRGVGLSNVYQRLRIYYGEQSDIKIESKLDVGTKITIYIPKEEAKKNEE